MTISLCLKVAAYILLLGIWAFWVVFNIIELVESFKQLKEMEMEEDF